MSSFYVAQIFMAWVCGKKKSIEFWKENILERATLKTEKEMRISGGLHASTGTMLIPSFMYIHR
jgi:hypothetical protein